MLKNEMECRSCAISTRMYPLRPMGRKERVWLSRCGSNEWIWGSRPQTNSAR